MFIGSAGETSFPETQHHNFPQLKCGGSQTHPASSKHGPGRDGDKSPRSRALQQPRRWLLTRECCSSHQHQEIWTGARWKNIPWHFCLKTFAEIPWANDTKSSFTPSPSPCSTETFMLPKPIYFLQISLSYCSWIEMLLSKKKLFTFSTENFETSVFRGRQVAFCEKTTYNAPLEYFYFKNK